MEAGPGFCQCQHTCWSAVCETLRTASLVPKTMPQLKSHHLALDFTMSPCPNAASCCHVIGWFTIYSNKKLNTAAKRSDEWFYFNVVEKQPLAAVKSDKSHNRIMPAQGFSLLRWIGVITDKHARHNQTALTQSNSRTQPVPFLSCHGPGVSRELTPNTLQIKLIYSSLVGSSALYKTVLGKVMTSGPHM